MKNLEVFASVSQKEEEEEEEEEEEPQRGGDAADKSLQRGERPSLVNLQNTREPPPSSSSSIMSSSLLLRTLLGLLLVSTATAQLTCWQQIPPVLIQNLWNQTRQLIRELPAGENSSVHHRLLPDFSKSNKTVIGWSDIKAVIDVYQRSVFNCTAVQKLLPLHYPEMLHRLQDTLQHCVSSSEPPKHLKLIKKFEQKIKKRPGDKGALKAVEELDFVFRWIDELVYQHIQ